MKTSLLFSLLIVFVSCASTSAEKSDGKWGSDITLTKVEDLTASKKALDKLEGKEVLIKAKVGKVCVKKGCWMTLKTDNEKIRVTFKDYSFFVPTKLMGKTVLAQGKLAVHKMSLKEAKHMAEDAGKNPDLVTKPITEYRFIASGVKLLKAL